ncbi:MAG: DUF1622 domain-containing protein [Cyanobacteria bacterium J06635_13]
MNFLLYFAIAATANEQSHGNPMDGFNHFAEGLLLETAVLFKIVIEGVALLILALAIIKAIKELVFRNRRMDREEKLSQVRLDLGVALGLSLEFLLAADIAATAVSPSWDAVGKLAAISAIRTFLNYFLEREVKALEAEKRNKRLEKQRAGI